MPKYISIAALSIVLLALAATPAELALASGTATQRRAAALDAEIDALSGDLRTEKDLAISVDQNFLADLTDQLAKASTHDFWIKVLPGRLISSKSDLGFAKYQNYLDLDGGEGSVDLREASIEGIKNGRIHVLIDLAGQVKTRAHGKEIGFNYSANPELGVSLRDRVAFVIEPENGEFYLRPVAKQLTAHLDIGVSVAALGSKVNTSQEIPIDIARLMQPIKLPHIISPSLRLPGRERAIALTNVGYRAENGKLQLDADLSFQ